MFSRLASGGRMLVKKALLQLGGVGIGSAGDVGTGAAELEAGGGISRSHNHPDLPGTPRPWMAMARATTTPAIEAVIRVIMQTSKEINNGLSLGRSSRRISKRIIRGGTVCSVPGIQVYDDID
jgi:hypothetical protein